MPRHLLLLALLACTPTTSTDGDGNNGEISTDPDDMAQEIVDLQALLADLQAAAQTMEARLADAEAQLADADVRLSAAEAAAETCATDIANLQEVDGQLVAELDTHGERLSALEAGSGTPIWSLSASSATGGRTTSWTSLGTDLDLTITRTDTLIAWCNAQEGGGTGMLRVTLTSADGGWTSSGTSSEPEESGYDSELIFAMATFTPPAAGDYVLSCEGKSSYGWEHYDVVVMQGAASIASEDDEL